MASRRSGQRHKRAGGWSILCQQARLSFCMHLCCKVRNALLEWQARIVWVQILIQCFKSDKGQERWRTEYLGHQSLFPMGWTVECQGPQRLDGKTLCFCSIWGKHTSLRSARRKRRRWMLRDFLCIANRRCQKSTQGSARNSFGWQKHSMWACAGQSHNLSCCIRTTLERRCNQWTKFTGRYI